MSYQETRRGKLKKIIHVNGICDQSGMLMELAKQLNIEKDYLKYLEDCEEDEAFMEACYDNDCLKYTIIGDDIYEILEDEELKYGFCVIDHNEDGTLDYVASWYNGGASLSEVLEKELSKKS